MKRMYSNRMRITAGIFLLFTCSLWAQAGLQPGRQGRQTRFGGACLLQSLPTKALTVKETEELLLLREEEKLARDVYLKLFEKWNFPVFQNIAASEQRHMDSLKFLLERFGLADPSANLEVGVFHNAKFSALFTDLIARGERSLVEAFRVGATIEDLDIYDLNRLLTETDHADLKFVYGNLRNGSCNHLLAFVRQMERSGESYSPQYVSPQELQEILTTTRGNGNGRRWGQRSGRGMGRGTGADDPRSPYGPSTPPRAQ